MRSERILTRYALEKTRWKNKEDNTAGGITADTFSKALQAALEHHDSKDDAEDSKVGQSINM